MDKDIIIYHNDLTDSDNWATARFLQRATLENPSIDVIWIVEPRPVSLGLSMTKNQIDACRELLELYFPSYEDSYKLLRGGFLQQSDLDKIEGLTKQHRDLLEFAIKPANGPKEDAILHGHLVALDLLAFLRCWSSNPVDLFLDIDTLDDIEMPMNLNLHYHEELLARSQQELGEYNSIMQRPYPQRIQPIRDWYDKCIQSLQHSVIDKDHTVSNLNLSSLCEKVKAAKSVKFFGGASLGLLQRLIHEDAVSNIECCLQVGAFDLSKSLFRNQFNIALNLDAAKLVLSKTQAFASFVIVPTETAKRVKYALSSLTHEDPTLSKRCLGFNCRVDPMEIATGEVTVNDLADESYPMPDLTAFFCTFQRGFVGATLARARLVDNDGQLVLRHDKSGILVYYGIPQDILVNEISGVVAALRWVGSEIGRGTR
ncbi:hypothetical protein GGS24DRAFT_482790 [Hypoxylon argillaceum]|nr:hypothetical protein GGS24DRAFT_482790 [Hypoxylon argillaceum]